MLWKPVTIINWWYLLEIGQQGLGGLRDERRLENDNIITIYRHVPDYIVS
jgi:hypothetical protein